MDDHFLSNLSKNADLKDLVLPEIIPIKPLSDEERMLSKNPNIKDVELPKFEPIINYDSLSTEELDTMIANLEHDIWYRKEGYLENLDATKTNAESSPEELAKMQAKLEMLKDKREERRHL